MADDLDVLRAALPTGRLITDPDIMNSYRRDQTVVAAPGQPWCVVVARSIDDVAAALAWAQQHRVPVVPRGGGTSLAGGATAVDGCLVLSLAEMTAIREIDPANEIVVAEAGVLTADLDRAAAGHGLMYAPDPSSFEISTIGGNLATNAGRLRRVKYGVTRDAVLGLEVVLADGRTLRTGRRTVKGVAGYDLTSLFVGSEGTLGVITSATLRLRPRPARYPQTVVAGFSGFTAAARAVTAILAARLQPSLLELMDHATLRAIDEWKHLGFGNDIQALLIAQDDSGTRDQRAELMRDVCLREGAALAEVSASEAESRQLLEIRRLAYPAVERLGAPLVEDVCVPRTRLPEMAGRIEQAADRHGVRIATVAHAGDGNLHPVFVFDRGLPEVPPAVWAAADEVFRAALELGGTLTGEHGVGVIKRRWLTAELGEESLAVHRLIKNALDPAGILNPGKVLLFSQHRPFPSVSHSHEVPGCAAPFRFLELLLGGTALSVVTTGPMTVGPTRPPHSRPEWRLRAKLESSTPRSASASRTCSITRCAPLCQGQLCPAQHAHPTTEHLPLSDHATGGPDARG